MPDYLRATEYATRKTIGDTNFSFGTGVLLVDMRLSKVIDSSCPCQQGHRRALLPFGR